MSKYVSNLFGGEKHFFYAFFEFGIKLLLIFALCIWFLGDGFNIYRQRTYVSKLYAAPFTSCMNIVAIPPNECQALVDLYNNTAGNNRSNNTNWLTTDDPCGFNNIANARQGVACTNGKVINLALAANNLIGDIPSSISNLSSLKYLQLGNNQISSIPDSIGSLSQLKTLDLYSNKIRSIPNGITNLALTTNLRLDRNYMPRDNAFNPIWSPNINSRYEGLNISTKKKEKQADDLAPSINDLSAGSNNDMYVNETSDFSISISEESFSMNSSNVGMGLSILGNNCAGLTISAGDKVNINQGTHNFSIKGITPGIYSNCAIQLQDHGGSYGSMDPHNFSNTIVLPTITVSNPTDLNLSVSQGCNGQEAIIDDLKYSVSFGNSGAAINNTQLIFQGSIVGATITNVSLSPLSTQTNCPSANSLNIQNNGSSITINGNFTIAGGKACTYNFTTLASDVEVNFESNLETLPLEVSSQNNTSSLSYSFINSQPELCQISHNITLNKTVGLANGTDPASCQINTNTLFKAGDRVCYDITFNPDSNRYRPINSIDPFFLWDFLPQINQGINVSYSIYYKLNGARETLNDSFGFQASFNQIYLQNGFRINPGQTLTIRMISEPLTQDFVTHYQNQPSAEFHNSVCPDTQVIPPQAPGNGPNCKIATAKVQLPGNLGLEKKTLNANLMAKGDYLAGESIDYYFKVTNQASSIFNGSVYLLDEIQPITSGYNINFILNLTPPLSLSLLNNAQFPGSSSACLSDTDQVTVTPSGNGAVYILQHENPFVINGLAPNSFCMFKLSIPILQTATLPPGPLSIQNKAWISFDNQNWTDQVQHSININGKVDAGIYKELGCYAGKRTSIFTIYNSGSVTISGLSINDTLPVGFTLNTLLLPPGRLELFTNQPTYCPNNVPNAGNLNQGIWNFIGLSLPPGGSCKYRAIMDGLSLGTIDNTATINTISPGTDNISSNNISNIRGTGYCSSEFNGIIQKTVEGVTNCSMGTTSKVKLKVFNMGSLPIQTFYLTDNLPNGINYLPGTLQTIGTPGANCGIVTENTINNEVAFQVTGANIAPNKFCTYSFDIQYTQAGSYTNIASLSNVKTFEPDGIEITEDAQAASPGFYGYNQSTTGWSCGLAGTFSLTKSIKKCSSADPNSCSPYNGGIVPIGTYIQYVITYQNVGQGPISGPITLSDTFPGNGLTYSLTNPVNENSIQITSPANLTYNGINSWTSQNGNIPVNQGGTLILGTSSPFQLTQEGSICNTAKIEGIATNSPQTSEACISVKAPSCSDLNGNIITSIEPNGGGYTVHYDCSNSANLQFGSFHEARLIIPGSALGTTFPSSTAIQGTLAYNGSDIGGVSVDCEYGNINPVPGAGNVYICNDSLSLPSCPNNVVIPASAFSTIPQPITCAGLNFQSQAFAGIPNTTQTNSSAGDQNVSCEYDFSSIIPGLSLNCPGTIAITEPPIGPACNLTVSIDTAGTLTANCVPSNGQIVGLSITFPDGNTITNPPAQLPVDQVGNYHGVCTVHQDGFADISCEGDTSYNPPDPGSCLPSALIATLPNAGGSITASQCPPMNNITANAVNPGTLEANTTPNTITSEVNCIYPGNQGDLTCPMQVNIAGTQDCNPNNPSSLPLSCAPACDQTCSYRDEQSCSVKTNQGGPCDGTDGGGGGVKHLACAGQACVEVDGGGPNTCQTNIDCTTTAQFSCVGKEPQLQFNPTGQGGNNPIPNSVGVTCSPDKIGTEVKQGGAAVGGGPTNRNLTQAGQYTAICKYPGGDCPKDFALAQSRQCPAPGSISYDKPSNKISFSCPDATNPVASFTESIITPAGSQGNKKQGVLAPSQDGTYALECKYNFNNELKSCPGPNVQVQIEKKDCENPSFSITPDNFLDSPASVNAQCNGYGSDTAKIEIIAPNITNNQNGIKQLIYKPLQGGNFTIRCTHDAPNMNKKVCEVPFTIQTRQRECPEDKNQVASIDANPQDASDPGLIKVLAGTPGSATCKWLVENKQANPSIKSATPGQMTITPNASYMTKGEYTVKCSFDYDDGDGNPGNNHHECERKVKAVFPKCDLEDSKTSGQEPASTDIKIMVKSDDGDDISPLLAGGIVAFPRCDITGTKGYLVPISAGGFPNVGNGTIGNIGAGSYNVVCAIKNAADTANTNIITCNWNFGVTSSDLDACKDKFKIDGQPADQNTPVNGQGGKVELDCAGGTLTIVPASTPDLKRTLMGSTFKYEGTKKDFLAECKINGLSCFGKFNLSGSGSNPTNTGETNPPTSGNSNPPNTGTSNLDTQLTGVKCTVDPVPGPIVDTIKQGTNGYEIGYKCNGGDKVTNYSVNITKTEENTEIAKQLGQSALQLVNSPGIYKIICTVSGDGGKTNQCETQIEVKTKEPKCIIKGELVNAKEKGEIKYTMQLDSAGLGTDQVEYICGLTNEADITESYAGAQLSATFAGIKAGSYKTVCLVRKNGKTTRQVPTDAVKCEDGPFSITPNGLDDCKDAIQVTPGTKVSDAPPITFNVTTAPATVACNNGTLQKPTSPTLNFKGVTSYDVICKMQAGFTCSAIVKGSGDALNTNNNPSSGGNSNGNSGGNGNNGNNGSGNNGSGNNSSGLNAGNTYDLAISKQITSKFIQLNTGINFSVTIRNEGAIPASGVSIRDMVFGLTGIKTGKDPQTLKSYIGNPALDMVLAFPINLAPGASATYYLQGTLIQSGFSNQVQVCDYNSGTDLDSDPCNGYDKGEDDDDIVGGNIYSGSVGDRVWMDSNENGLQETGEVGVSNVQIQLLRCGDNSLIATGITKTDGKYLFMGINPGSYRLQVSLSGTSNLKFTKFKQGTNDAIDSDITPYSGGIGMSDCISIVGGQNYLKLDAGVTLIPNDIAITKKTTRKFVTDGDIVKRSIILSNSGEGTITNYTLADKIPGILSYKVISLSGYNTDLVRCGYPLGRAINNNTLTGKVSNALIKPGESCYFELSTQVNKNINTGSYYNIACATGVNQEGSGKFGNNCSSDSIQVIKACPNIQVSPDFGDSPMNSQFNCTLSGNNTGYIQILNSNDILLKSYNTLSGYHLFSGNGYYYVECVSKQFTERCMRPVDIRELSECLDLELKDSNNNTVSGGILSGSTITAGTFTAYCSGQGAESYKITIRAGSKTGAIVQSITGQSGSFTITEPGIYFAQCIVNNTIDYKFDRLSQLNAGVDLSTNNCPYKLSTNGSMCAVEKNITPYKQSFIALSEFKYSIDPIEYCDPTIVNTLSCNVTNYEKTLVKNHNSCLEQVTINQHDLLIKKNTNKLFYEASGKTDTVTYTIEYQNIGALPIYSASIQDTLPEFLSLNGTINNINASGYALIANQRGRSLQRNLSGTIKSNQSGILQFITSIQANIKLPIKNKAIANAAGDKYLANNISEVTIYPLGRNISGNSIGDRVWSDDNFNGIQNSGEIGIRNVKIDLVSCSGNFIFDTRYSDTQGYYTFSNIQSGYYKISANLPSGFVFTYGKVGTDDKIDSDITLGSKSNCFYFDASGNNFNKDVGLYDVHGLSGNNCNYNRITERNLGEECDTDDGVFGAGERCIACKIHKLFPSCGDGIVQPGEGCDCSSILPAGSSCVDCQILSGSLCGNGKLEGLEECETNSSKIPGLQCISCKLVSNSMSQCGNGIMEAGEMCDLGTDNGSSVTISGGRFSGKGCSNNCTVVDNTCNITNKYNVPECSQIISPNIMEGEFLPFWRDINNNQIINSNNCQPGKIPSDTVFCSFSLYNGKLGTDQSLTNFTIPCINPQLYDSPLLQNRNAISAKYIGRSSIQIADRITKGVYGEYKLQLNRIDYAVCSNSGSLIQKTVQGAALINASSTGVICEYNFTVSRPYLMQVGNIISSNQSDKLANFYGFDSNTKKQNILAQYGIKLDSLTLNKFLPSANATYIMTQFTNKQLKVALRAIEYGPKTSRVPGVNIFIYDGNISLDKETLPSNSPSTIIVKNGNLTISGSIKTNNLYIVPDGNIIFSNGCNQNQEIYGALITNKDFLSDIPYTNNNLLNKRCQDGGLTIYGTIIGKGLDNLINKRRSKLDNWFTKTDYRNKYQSIINGGAVTIKSNPLLTTTPPPGRTELTNSITTLKQ